MKQVLRLWLDALPPSWRVAWLVGMAAAIAAAVCITEAMT